MSDAPRTHYVLSPKGRPACKAPIRPTGAPVTTTDPTLVTCARCEVHAWRHYAATCRASSALVVATYASLVSAVRAWQQGCAPGEQGVIRALAEVDAVARAETPTPKPRTALDVALDALGPKRGAP